MDIGTIFTKVLAVSTLLGNIFTVFFVFAHFGMKDTFRTVSEFIGKHALRLGFLLAFAATFGSITYSQVVGYPACILCWMQRIFMYPEVALFGLALWRNDRKVLPYTLMLAVIGGVIALYNWAKDMLALYTDISLACPVVPGLPTCDRIYVDEFGYITIAMLSLNAFVLIAIICYTALRLDKKQQHAK